MNFKPFELESYVDQTATKHNVHLSHSARHSLIGPILEAQHFGSTVTNDQVKNSVSTLIASTAQHGDPLTGNATQITSLAIAQAIQLHYCNIPPFCAPPTTGVP